MSQSGQQTAWSWDATARKYYVVDPRNGDLVYEDGNRVPRTTFTGNTAGPADYQSLEGGGQNYTHRPQERSQPSQSSRQGATGAQRASSASTGSNPNTVSNAARDISRLTLGSLQGQQPRATNVSVPSTSRGGAATRPSDLIDFTNPNTGVRTVLETGPRDRITDERFANAGVFAQARLLETDGESEPLYENYRKRTSPRNYFVCGRVFFTLWAEPAGTSNSQATGAEPAFRSGRYGERVYSKVRRFVVILEGHDFCTCLPITTYGRQGVAKRGVIKSHHSIIHTSRNSPAPLQEERARRGEDNMQPEPIRVDADDTSDKLTELSRLDYGKFYTVHHNLKVRNLGKVNPNSMTAFQQQFTTVFQLRSTTGPIAPSRLYNTPAVLPSIQEDREPVQRRDSTTMRSANLQSSAQRAAEQSRQDNRRRETLRQAVISRSNGSSDEESGSDDEQPARSAMRPSPQASRSSARQEAIARLVQRGYSTEQAIRALDEQIRQQQSSYQQGPSQTAEGDSSESDDSSESGPSTQRSARSRTSTDRTRGAARRQQSGNSRSTGSSNAPATGSQPQARENAPRPQGPAQRRQSTSDRTPGQQQSSHATSSQANMPTRAVAGPSNPSTARSSQPASNNSAAAATESERARRWEAAIQSLVSRGYTHSQAIAYLQQRNAGGGSSH